MFPRFRERLGTAVDLVVEFSTLGEYRLPAREHGSWRPSAAQPAALNNEPAWEGPARGVSLRGVASAAAVVSPARRLDEATTSRRTTVPSGRVTRELLERAGGATHGPFSDRLAPPASPGAHRHERERHAPTARPARKRRPGTPATAPQPCLAAEAGS